MAASMIIACPGCKKKFKGPANLEGKKIRCPGCSHIFIVPPAATDKGVSAPAPAGAPGTPKPQLWDEEDNNPNPYGVTELDIAARCPHCANLMPAEDAIICLYCGYNTMTRELGRIVKTVAHTGGERFLWLLPGLLCVAGIIFLVNVDIFYCCALPRIIEVSSWADEFFNAEACRLWMAVLPSLFMMWPLGYFAFKRLVLNPVPPEKVKD
jgi:DNA-directed RNA polymerase subunit RPC12/RpoP